MKPFSKEHFRQVTVQRGTELEGADFERCVFEQCRTLAGRPRPILRNSRVSRCRAKGSDLYNMCFEDVLVEDFASGGMLQVLGCGFTRTILRGKFDSLFIREEPGLDSGNGDLYSRIDWALDVSQAEFKDCDIRGIPTKLLRLDTETQVVVTRQRALETPDWERLTCSRWRTAVKHLLDPRLQLETQVMIAGKRSPKFKELLSGISELRELGLAEIPS